MKRLLLLSGAMGAGKSTIALELKEKHSFQPISTSAFLRTLQNTAHTSNSRLSLQDLGDRLDSETNFSWIINSVAEPIIKENIGTDNWLFDAVRKIPQVNLLRHQYGPAVRHVHLVAPEIELQRRYLKRNTQETKANYLLAIEHPNEVSARSLSSVADHTFDTTKFSKEEITKEILGFWENEL